MHVQRLVVGAKTLGDLDRGHVTAEATGESTLGKGCNSTQSSRTWVPALCCVPGGNDAFVDDASGDKSMVVFRGIGVASFGWGSCDQSDQSDGEKPSLISVIARMDVP